MKNKHGILNLTFILALSILIILASACAKTSEGSAKSEKPGEDAAVLTDGKIKATENEIKYKSDDGEKSFEANLDGEVSVPKDYPSDIVPLYKGSKVSMASKEGENYTIIMNTDGSIDDIYKFYEKNIKLDSTIINQNSDGVATIIGVAGDLNVSIMVTENDIDEYGKNLITVSLYKIAS